MCSAEEEMVSDRRLEPSPKSTLTPLVGNTGRREVLAVVEHDRSGIKRGGELVGAPELGEGVDNSLLGADIPNPLLVEDVGAKHAALFDVQGCEP